MKRTEIAAVYADSALYAGKEVTVCGWVRTVRDMKTFGFIELNDGSCFKICRSYLRTAKSKIIKKWPS